MSKFAVILAAAGKSTRFSQGETRRKKPFVELQGRPVWVRSAELFVNRDDVIQTVIAIAPDDMEWFREKFQANLAFMDLEIVPGGRERADSIQNALARIRDDADFVAVHDAARPLLVKEWIDRVFRAAEQSGAAIPGTKVASTLKRVAAGGVIETVSREGLWEAQTPQVFRRTLLMEAYAKRGDFQPTDESQLVERLGHPVSLVEVPAMNFKITSSDDFRMAEAVVNVLPKAKTLRALHPFADEEARGL